MTTNGSRIRSDLVCRKGDIDCAKSKSGSFTVDAHNNSEKLDQLGGANSIHDAKFITLKFNE